MDKPKVLIERHAWAKMFGWCRAAESEVSGYGLCYYEDGMFRVYDVFLPKQYCSSGYTEVDDKANIMLQKKLYRWKRDMTHYRFWWHTHYNFGVFWSGTDDRNAEEQVKINGDWNLALVINQKGDYKCRIDSMRKFSNWIDKIDDLDCFLVPNSRTHKRKRNYKSDIKRWVRPMSEMPKTQNEKGISRTAEDSKPSTPVMTSYQWPNYGNNWKESEYPKHHDHRGWEDYWAAREFGYERVVDKPNDDVPPTDAIVPDTNDVVQEQLALGNTETPKPKEEYKAMPQAGIVANFGTKRYVLYEGRWVREELWKQLISCHCIDGNCINCIDIKAAEVEKNERAIQESEQAS